MFCAGISFLYIILLTSYIDDQLFSLILLQFLYSFSVHAISPILELLRKIHSSL